MEKKAEEEKQTQGGGKRVSFGSCLSEILSTFLVRTLEGLCEHSLLNIHHSLLVISYFPFCSCDRHHLSQCPTQPAPCPHPAQQHWTSTCRPTVNNPAVASPGAKEEVLF
jgi:hypothetical protein